MSRRATLPTDRSSSFLVRKPRRDATRLDVNVDCVRDTLAQREHLLSLSLSLSCLCALARNRPLLVGHVRRGEHLSAMGWQACVARHDMHRLRQGTSLSPRAPHPISCPCSPSHSLTHLLVCLVNVYLCLPRCGIPSLASVRPPRTTSFSARSLAHANCSLSLCHRQVEQAQEQGRFVGLSAEPECCCRELVRRRYRRRCCTTRSAGQGTRRARGTDGTLHTSLSLSLSCPHSACRHQQQPSQCTVARSDDGSTTSCSTRKMASAILKAFECVR